MMSRDRGYRGIDYARLAAAILVVADSHLAAGFIWSYRGLHTDTYFCPHRGSFLL